MKTQVGLPPRPVIDRFMEKIDRTSSDCWLWTAGLFHDGYACFRDENKVMRRAHRWSYEHFKEPIPEGLMVMHACDVKHCVNPDHLSVGTNADNQRDKWRKGRGRGGSRHWAVEHAPKLNRAIADEIRARYSSDWNCTHQSLADEYQVSRQMVTRIINGLAWAW